MEPRYLVYQGYLQKSPPEKKMASDKWQKRYFKLWNDRMLEYYKNNTDKKPRKNPIDLTQCSQVCDAKEDYKKYYKSTKKRWPFCLTMPGRLYVLLAYSEAERTTWKEKICELCSIHTENTNKNYVHNVPIVNSQTYSPNMSSNSSHTGSDSPETHQHTFPISIPPTPNEIISGVCDYSASDASWEDEEPVSNYDELPPPRVANNVSYSKSFNERHHFNTNELNTHSYKEPNRLSGYSAGRSMTMGSAHSNQSFPRNDSDVFIYDVPPSNSLYDTPPSHKKISIQSGGQNYDLVQFNSNTYDVPPSNNPYDVPPNKNFGASLCNENYNIPPYSQNYDVPPSSNQRMKQASTKTPNTNEIGYVKMDPSDDCANIDYIHMEPGGEPGSEEYIQMNPDDYVGLVNSPTPKPSVKEFKSIGNLDRFRLPSSKGSEFNVETPLPSKPDVTGRISGSFQRNPVLDEVPQGSNRNKVVQDNITDPPAVDRKVKPGPTINRAMKPKMSTGDELYINSSEYSSTSTGYFNLSPPKHGGSFQNTSTSTTTSTSDMYTDDQTEHYKTAPYSTHKNNNISLTVDSTNYYRDTNNNQFKGDLTDSVEDEYAQKELPTPPSPLLIDENTEEIYMSPPNRFKSVDRYENVDLSIQSDIINQDSYENLDNDGECYINVSEVLQGCPDSPDSGDLSYIQLAPLLTGNNIRPAEPQAGYDGYIKVDALKSAAAKDLR